MCLRQPRGGRGESHSTGAVSCEPQGAGASLGAAEAEGSPGARAASRISKYCDAVCVYRPISHSLPAVDFSFPIFLLLIFFSFFVLSPLIIDCSSVIHFLLDCQAYSTRLPHLFSTKEYSLILLLSLRLCKYICLCFSFL